MSLAYDDLRELVREIEPLLLGGQLQEIYQPADTLLLLNFYKQTNQTFYVSVASGRTAAFLTERPRPPQGVAKDFLQYLRKHLRGRRLAGVRLAANSRTLTLLFGGPQLVLELLHQRGNMLFVDGDGKIGRSLLNNDKLAGASYVAPAAEASNPRREIPEAAESFSKRAEKYYQQLELTGAQRESLRNLKQAITRQRRKLDNLRSDLAEAGEAQKYLKYGEALKGMLGMPTKAETKTRQSVRIEWIDGGLDVPLPEGMGIKEAMQHYFRLHKKLERKTAEVTARLGIETAKLEELTKQESELAPDMVATTGLLPIGLAQNASVERQKRDKQKWPSGVGEHAAPDGHVVLLGKNARGNDALLKVAKDNDLWLHVRDFPGSHCLILRQGKREIPGPTIAWAARLALQHSKAKQQGSGDVIVAIKSDVKKFKNAKPGQVKVIRSQTLHVKL